MKYKVICVDTKTIKTVEANNLYDAIKKIKDERLSPSTYKALKELGVGPNQWKNWSQEQATKYIEQRRQKSGEKKESKSEETSSEKTKQPIQSETYDKLYQYVRKDRFGHYKIPHDWGEEDAQKYLARKEAQKKSKQNFEEVVDKAYEDAKKMFTEEQLRKADDSYNTMFSWGGHYNVTGVGRILKTLNINAWVGDTSTYNVIVRTESIDDITKAATFFRRHYSRATIRTYKTDDNTIYEFTLPYRYET